MKHFIYFMIFLMLLGVWGCSHDSISQQGAEAELSETEPPVVETPEIETKETEPPTVELNEIEQTEVEQKEDETPVVEQPTKEPPETEPSTVVPPVVIPPVVVPPETEPPTVIPPTVEPPVVIPPVVVPPVVIPPIVEPPQVEPPIIVPPTESPVIPPVEPPIILSPTTAFLEINELRTEFLSSTHRTEYIEFKVKSSGSLNGISVHIMHNANNPFIYNFPAANVALGEYITLHLQTYDTSCVNELGDNLSSSGGYDSCPTARDLWVTGTVENLYKTDIVYLQNESGGIMDAIIINESPKVKWAKEVSHFEGIAENLFNAGMWKAVNGGKPTYSDSVDSSSTSMYRSVSRHEGSENTHTKNDWYVSEINKTTPGLPNK